MDFSFNNTPLVIALAIAVLIIGIHVLSVLLAKKKMGTALTAVNILLHIAFSVLMFFAGARLDVIAVSMMTSVLIYSLTSCITYTVSKKRNGGNVDDV